MIFRAVTDDIDKSQVHLALFKTNLTGVKNELNSPDTTGFAKIGQALSGLNAKLLATKALALALNTAISMGLAYVVSKGIQWIDDYIHKEEKAAKAAEEARKQRDETIQKGAESAKTYEKEASSIQDLVSRYANLISTTSDLNDRKDELVDIQKQLTDAYGSEKTGIDLVNKSLEENIRLMDEQEQKANKKYLREHAEEIATAKEYFELDEKTGTVGGSWKAASISTSSEVVGKSYIKSIKDYLEKEYPDLVKNAQEYLDVNPLSGKINFGMEIISGLTPEETFKTAQALSEAYQYAADLRDNNDVDESSLLGVNEAWVKRIENAYEILKKAGELKNEVDSWSAFEKTDDFEKYTNLVGRAVSLTQTINSDTSTVADKFKASLELDKVKGSLDELAQKYPDIADNITSKTEGLGITFNNVSNTIETAKEAWVKSLDEAQKGVLSDVDKITSAMEKLYAGEGIDQKSAWEILNMDDDKLLSNIKIVDGKYVFDLEQIVSLKDQIIQKEIEQRKESIATAKESAQQAKDDIAFAKQRMFAITLERSKAIASGDLDKVAELNAEYKSLANTVQKDTDALNGFNYTIRNETLYVEQLSGSLGDLAETADVLQAIIKRLQKELEALNKKADGMLKAQEHVIDGIIGKYEDELDVLEKQQDSLEEQLDVLEKQRDELDDIIDRYKTVSNYVQDTISKQIEEIEDNRKEIEDYYDNLIDKLKTENEEREDAIEYEKKLAALNNAKNNKVRSYDQARGWTYEANKDAIQEAQNDLDKFENEQAIKSLEKQKEEATAGFDERIKELEAYSKEWKDAIDGITEAENDLIATEILGSDWREKIAKRDEETLTKFKAAFSKYNTDLAKLTKNEIENLKSSINAVKDEVEAKKKQIQVWKDYKTELTSAASDIKNGLEDYVEYLGTVSVTENSTNADRLTNLQNFKNSYSAVVAEIVSKNAQIEETTKQYDNLIEAMKKVTSITGGNGGIGGDIGNALASAINFFAEKIKELKDVLDPLKDVFKIMSDRAKKLKDTDKELDDILGFAGGGAADYTGLAMLHGTKQKSETIFTAAQSKKLLGLVEMMPDYSKLLSTPPRVEANKTTTNNIAGATFSIANMTVVANNPEQFESQMKRYWQTKLTESKVY